MTISRVPSPLTSASSAPSMDTAHQCPGPAAAAEAATAPKGGFPCRDRGHEPPGRIAVFGWIEPAVDLVPLSKTARTRSAGMVNAGVVKVTWLRRYPAGGVTVCGCHVLPDVTQSGSLEPWPGHRRPWCRHGRCHLRSTWRRGKDAPGLGSSRGDQFQFATTRPGRVQLAVVFAGQQRVRRGDDVAGGCQPGRSGAVR
jgi:hypothetical protein